MTRRLYTVTLACPEIVVLAEDEADALRVVERTLRNGLLNPADGPAATGARELDHLPDGYTATTLPYGGDRDETIGELIEHGAAPGYRKGV